MSDLQHSNNNLAASITSGLAALQQLKQNATTYSAQISRNQPTALVFLIDQSGSMGNAITLEGGIKTTLAEALADILNRLLQEILLSITKENDIRGYFDLLLIGYGQRGEAKLLWDTNSPDPWVNSSKLEEFKVGTKEVEVIKKTRSGESIVKVTRPIWITAEANGNTPMNQAIQLATLNLIDWLGKYPNSFPPMVFNITDGAATDAKENTLLATAHQLKKLGTTDGNILFFNIHLSTNKDQADKVFLPFDSSKLPNDEFAHLLYEMSSTLPNTPTIKARLRDLGLQIDNSSSDMAVAMTFNETQMEKIMRLLQIGTIQTIKV